jgi:hypothetical protein
MLSPSGCGTFRGAAHRYREGGLRTVYYRKLIPNITNNIIIVCIVIPKSLETVGAWF